VDKRFDDLRAVVAPLAGVFLEAGHSLYLVGGVIRNALLVGEPSSPDFDLTTDAFPEQIRDLVAGSADAVWLQGELFGTVGARIGEHTLEITTHRSEAYLDDSRKPVVTFSRHLAEDLARRDFTVNAMAVDIGDGTLHDPFDGRADLEAGILRTPLAPEESFSDDPLRMLRAARFVADYRLTPTAGLVEAARRLVRRVSIVSVERVREELLRLLAVEDPRAGLDLLVEIGLLEIILPNVAALDDSSRQTAFDRVSIATNNPLVRLAALLLDFEPALVRYRVLELRFSRREQAIVEGLVRTAQRIRSSSSEGGWSAEEVRRLAESAGDLLDEAFNLAVASGVDTDSLVAVVGELKAAGELEDLGPALNGRQVMAILDLVAGPEVGEALAWLADLRFRKGRLSIEDAEVLLVNWWRSREDDT
jgi:poly(A) polymerase